MRRFIKSALPTIFWGMLVCSANLQAAGLPGTVQPGQIERQFQQTPEIRATEPAPIGVPEAEQPAPSNAQDIHFTLTQLVIEGATVYTEDALLADFKARIGAEVALADIYQIASALTTKYRNAGYILSRVVVPAQSVEDGVVHLKVIEGYIAEVTIEGVDGDRRQLVQSYADKIKQSRPLTNAVLERYMLLINDLPGAFARAAIKSSASEPGASDLIVQFSQRKVQGGLSLDNRGGKSLGPLRFSGDIEFNSLLGLEESTSLRFVSSGDSELNYFSFSHDEQIGSEGGKLNLAFSAVRSKPEEDSSFIPLNLETNSNSGSITYSHPLIRSRSKNLTLRSSLTAHDGETKIFGFQVDRDRIRALRLGATFDLADSLRGLNIVDFEFSKGLKGLGASANGDPSLSRASGRVDFSKMTLYAARLQALAPKISLLAALNAQHASDDLLSSELFSFGGEQFGRGYDPSELVGDDGLAMKLELRYTDSLPTNLGSYTGYTFYDLGKVYHRNAGSLVRTESAASAGAGLRVGLGEHTSGFIELAKPLTKEVAAEGNRDLRVYAGVTYRF